MLILIVNLGPPWFNDVRRIPTCLAAEAVDRSALTLQRVHNVHGLAVCKASRETRCRVQNLHQAGIEPDAR